MNDIFDALNKRRSPYSMEEIEKAEKQAKKTGKSFMDVLQDTSGKRMGDSKKAASKHDDVNQSMQQLLQSMNERNQKEIDQLRTEKKTQEEWEALQAQIAKDFGITSDSISSNTNNENMTPKKVEEQNIDLQAFDGVEDAVKEHVFGQDSFLKKLTVAFKRPFILPEEENHARNSFFVHGPKHSGKHYALTKLAEELAKRHILSSAQIHTMDLCRYNATGKDNVFLQDLYVALQSDAKIVLFENFAECNTSYLTYINDLVTKGECYLQDRYSLQRGQLVNVANTFTKETVSTFSASGKYLVFLGTKNIESLANVFGAPFVNALGDICTADALTEESWRKIAKVQWEALKEKADKQLSFTLSAKEELILDQAIAATGKNAGTEGLLRFFDQLLKGLATLKLEGNYPKETGVSLEVEENVMYAKIGEEKSAFLENLPVAYTGDISAVKQEMDQIVGLTKVKEYIFSLEEYYNTQKRRTEAGLKASDVSKHMIFTGNPGTGKTTIARIISRYLKAIGVLTGGQLVEVSRADLVGRYVGHTAPLVNQVMKSALGGVLFIDEAYSLYRGRDDNFGLEAIDTLVKGIEDNRDNLIVILAGYSNEMEEFLEANSGLKSRFPNIIDFPDYTGEELLEITKITVKSKGYILDAAAEESLLEFYTKVQEDHPETAGNGRLVRNKVEEAILNQSRRLVAEPDADLSLLQLKDFDFTEK